MRPPKEQLTGDWRVDAQRFGVSERTARRWLEFYGMYHPVPNFGSSKLNFQLAREIRCRYTNEGVSIKDLAQAYNVTFSTISRILHNQTYPEKDTAKISMTYNEH